MLSSNPWADPPCLARGSQDMVLTRPTAPAVTSYSGVNLERQGTGHQSPGSKHPTDKELLKAPKYLVFNDALLTRSALGA